MQGSTRKDVVFGAARIYTGPCQGQNGNPGLNAVRFPWAASEFVVEYGGILVVLAVDLKRPSEPVQSDGHNVGEHSYSMYPT